VSAGEPGTVAAGLIDSHCHLGHIDRPPDDVLADARAAGVDAVIDIGMGLVESRTAAARAAATESVYASVGIHPNDLTEFVDHAADTIAELREIARAPGVVAIGETGLDFYRDRWTPEQQESSFRAHIALAKDADRTLVIHCRDAHDRVLYVLDDESPPSRVVMHCFSGDVAFARACNERGYYSSFAGNITYKRNDDLRDAARAVDEHLLLIETDAPFLAPEPFRGKANAPALVVHTAARLAEVRNANVNTLTSVLRKNTHRAFVIAPHDLHERP
jgi:TatD DNase family protein